MRCDSRRRSGVAALAMMGACAWPLVAAGQSPSNKDFCAANGTNLMFAIDTTTPYDARDQEILVRAIGNMLESLKGGDRLVIRTITESFSTSEQLIQRCVPRCSAEGTLDRLLRCNQGIIVNETKKVKRETVEALRAGLANVKQRPHSDIVQTLAFLSREEVQHGGNRILYVFSDMIENSTHLPGRVFFSADNKRLINQLKRSNLIASLQDVDVRVFGVGRDGTTKRGPLPVGSLQKLLEFWNLYFKAALARSIEISPNMIEHDH